MSMRLTGATIGSALMWMVGSISIATAGCSASVAPTSPDMAMTGSKDLSMADQSVAGDQAVMVPDFAGADFAQCLATCTKAGAVTCSGNSARTCQLVNGCLQLSPATDCGSGLCCATGCVPMDGSNCGACGDTCGGQKPACSAAAPYSCVCTGAACATVQQDCNSTTGSCQACAAAPVPENRTDFWVDNQASAIPTGSQGCPYATIGKALQQAAMSNTTLPKTIHVSAGTYTTTGTNAESFPLVLRGGTSLVGAGAGNTILSGTASYDHSSLGGALNGAYQLTIVVGDPSKPTTLSNLSIVSNVTGTPGGNVIGVLCDEGNAVTPYTNPPVSPYPAASLTVDKVTVGPGYGQGLVVTNVNSATSGKSACNALVTNSTFTGNVEGMWVVGGGQGTASSPPVSAQIGNLTGGGNRFVNNTTAGGSGYGIVVWDTASPVRVYGNTFDRDDYGLAIAQHPLFDPSITVVGYFDVQSNVFQNLNVAGIFVGVSAVLNQLIGNTFTNVSSSNVLSGTPQPAYAVELAGSNSTIYRPEILKARNNRFIANDIALGIINGPAVNGSNPMVTDFGNASDPGNNVFLCNATPSAYPYPGGDVIVSATGSNNGVLNFAGNGWDHTPPTQSASISNGTDIVLATPAPMVDLSSSTVVPTPCPVTIRPK